MHAADVVERLADGAALVQVWTGMIYGGPRWPRAVVRSLIDGRF
jgi:dihydroorotate dehydrogenase